MKRLENPGLIKSRKNYSPSPINYLASARNAPLRRDPAFPQIQALRDSNFLRENIESWTKEHCLAANRFMVLRLGYTVGPRPGAAAPLGHELKRVNEPIPCDGGTTISALELRLLRALQSRILQGAGRFARFNASVPANSEHHTHVAGNARRPRKRAIARRRQFSYDHFGILSVGSNRFLSRACASGDKRHRAIKRMVSSHRVSMQQIL
jgi:hypothetical protein